MSNIRTNQKRDSGVAIFATQQQLEAAPGSPGLLSLLLKPKTKTGSPTPRAVPTIQVQPPSTMSTPTETPLAFYLPTEEGEAPEIRARSPVPLKEHAITAFDIGQNGRRAKPGLLDTRDFPPVFSESVSPPAFLPPIHKKNGLAIPQAKESILPNSNNLPVHLAGDALFSRDRRPEKPKTKFGKTLIVSDQSASPSPGVPKKSNESAHVAVSSDPTTVSGTSDGKAGDGSFQTGPAINPNRFAGLVPSEINFKKPSQAQKPSTAQTRDPNTPRRIQRDDFTKLKPALIEKEANPNLRKYPPPSGALYPASAAIFTQPPLISRAKFLDLERVVDQYSAETAKLTTAVAECGASRDETYEAAMVIQDALEKERARLDNLRFNLTPSKSRDGRPKPRNSREAATLRRLERSIADLEVQLAEKYKQTCLHTAHLQGLIAGANAAHPSTFAQQRDIPSHKTTLLHETGVIPKPLDRHAFAAHNRHHVHTARGTAPMHTLIDDAHMAFPAAYKEAFFAPWGSGGGDIPREPVDRAREQLECDDAPKQPLFRQWELSAREATRRRAASPVPAWFAHFKHPGFVHDAEAAPVDNYNALKKRLAEDEERMAVPGFETFAKAVEKAKAAAAAAAAA